MAAVQRNLGVTFCYMAIYAALSAIVLGLDHLVIGIPDADQPLSAAVKTYELVKQLGVVVIQAVVQSVVFARMGREMDRPLWRNPDDWTAVKRFFNLWLTLGLVETVWIQLATLTAEAESGGAGLLFMVYLLTAFIKIPIGACVMFYGAFVLKEFGRAIAPLGVLFPKLMLLMLVNFCVLGLVLLGFGPPDSTVQYVVTTALTAISAYAECVVFAGAWLMCIEHRSLSDDADFEF